MKMKSHLYKVERKFNEEVPHDKIRLHSAERNEDFSDEMWNKFISSLSQSDIKYYPNLNTLYSRVCDYFELPDPSNLIIGNGSDRILKYAFEVFVRARSKVISTTPCFPMYKVYSDLYNAKFVGVPYKDQHVDVTNIMHEIDDNTSAVFLSNPSSPVGDVIDLGCLISIAKKCRDHDVLFVVDEAYIEFSNVKSFAEYVTDFDNVLITRTLSKAHGSAGVRFGVGYGTPAVGLKRFRDMYEINGLTMRWIETLCDNKQDFLDHIKRVQIVRSYMNTQARKLAYDVVDSQCNWLHINTENDNLTFDNDEFIIRGNCTIPGDKRTNWIRLCVPENFETADRVLNEISTVPIG